MLGSGRSAAASSCASEWRPFTSSSAREFARGELRREAEDLRPLRLRDCLEGDLRREEGPPGFGER